MATLLLSHVFACCLGKRQRPDQDRTVPDDHSRLIPASPESPFIGSSDIAVVDYQKYRERMDRIVRSKEGKMVNVNSQLPFNLYNKPLMALDPSSSRSASASTIQHSVSRFKNDHQPAQHPVLQITSLRSAHTSPTRSSSRSRGASASSSPPRQARRNHEIDDIAPLIHVKDADEETDLPRRILNVRLIRDYGPIPRRGRPKARSKCHDQAPLETMTSVNSSQLPAGQVSEPFSNAVSDPSERSPLENISGASSPERDKSTIRDDQTSPKPSSSHSFPRLSISPASDTSFRIHDFGAIILSWSD